MEKLCRDNAQLAYSPLTHTPSQMRTKVQSYAKVKSGTFESSSQDGNKSGRDKECRVSFLNISGCGVSVEAWEKSIVEGGV